jgi:hypothetical protein
VFLFQKSTWRISDPISLWSPAYRRTRWNWVSIWAYYSLGFRQVCMSWGWTHLLEFWQFMSLRFLWENSLAVGMSATLVLETSVFYDYFPKFIAQFHLAPCCKKNTNGRTTLCCKNTWTYFTSRYASKLQCKNKDASVIYNLHSIWNGNNSELRTFLAYAGVSVFHRFTQQGSSFATRSRETLHCFYRICSLSYKGVLVHVYVCFVIQVLEQDVFTGLQPCATRCGCVPGGFIWWRE